MGFEDKMNQIQGAMAISPRTEKVVSKRRISKSYTLREEIADEITRRGEADGITASRWLELYLKKQFKI